MSMVKKMKLIPFLSKRGEVWPSWLWPSCSANPRTLSFRAIADLLDQYEANGNAKVSLLAPQEPWLNEPPESDAETVIRGLQSERLFFEPGETSSIMKEAKQKGNGNGGFPFKESVIMSMESIDPYVDFRASMQEMVEAHGLKDWECLEELLSWYLKVNGKKNHEYIVGAFVDLLIDLALSGSTTSICCHLASPSSPLSFNSSPSSSSPSSSSSSTTTPCVSSVIS
ncbi:Ovate protein family, C-terminal [Dillenia turbinata]|uniref:Transcription repressor n=1 Tax=Dillenia turbinata TaxID=194707 RepID=A0AAN8ZRG0_9MAGN